MKKLIYILILGLFTQCSNEANYLDDCGIVISSVSRNEKYGSGYKGYETIIEYSTCGKECFDIRTTVEQFEVGTKICY